MYKVFVSYSSKDIKWASLLKQLLADVHASVYVAEFDLEARDVISDEVSKNIKNCDLFILLWSGKSRKSSYVEKEIFLAKSEHKKILPIVLQNNLPLPTILGDLKPLDVNKDADVDLVGLKNMLQLLLRKKQLVI
jgi:hypothetical protein